VPPMLAYLLYRNEAVSATQFVAHYRTVHSPLSVAAIPLQTFYAANVARPGTSSPTGWGRGRSPVDALALIGFDDLGVLTDPDRLYATVELGERLNADGAFMFSGMDGYVVDTALRWGAPRTWPVGQESPGVQHITLACRRAGLGAADFRRRLQELVETTSRSVGPDALGGALHFVISSVNPDAPALDAIVELRCASIAEGDERWRSVATALAELCDTDATRSVIADETIWID
jgi:hypothetical protein